MTDQNKQDQNDNEGRIGTSAESGKGAGANMDTGQYTNPASGGVNDTNQQIDIGVVASADAETRPGGPLTNTGSAGIGMGIDAGAGEASTGFGSSQYPNPSTGTGTGQGVRNAAAGSDEVANTDTGTDTGTQNSHNDQGDQS